MPQLAAENGPISIDRAPAIYETWSELSSDVAGPARRYNRRRGGQPRATRGAVMADLLDFVSLSLLPPWCWRVAADWLRRGDPPDAVLRRLLAARSRDEPDQNIDVRALAADAIRRAGDASIAAIPWSAPSYPAALTTIADPPPVLWTRGRVEALSAPAVAIVGSRAASPYGLAVAEQLAADLAANGLVIVSGLARGVDSAAHRGALAAGGVTVAVLGSGVDVVYPPEHAPLAKAIDEVGAVISELVPGTGPQQWFFPLRNRIISGLSRAVVVIEAGEKSGSLITARCAGAGTGVRPPGADEGRGLTAPPDPVLDCLVPGEACDLDEIAERSGLKTARLLPRLFELELQGRVRRVGGGRFVRIDRTC
jgi:DNA protecting protein DprA